MGYGDEIMGSGLARGAFLRGRKVALGDGKRILWSPAAWQIFHNNENVAAPGTERAGSLEWIWHYTGNRIYCQMRPGERRWTFRPGTQKVGELFFKDDELAFAGATPPGFVLIEPNVKNMGRNKQWPVQWYAKLATNLRARGHRVLQFHGSHVVADQLRTDTFRQAAAVLARAALYIGPEGGLHHAAAALGVPAVVIFGGFISPQVTGYAGHVNLFSGEGLGCGTIDPCRHCREAMERISVDQVLGEAMQILRGGDEGHSARGTARRGAAAVPDANLKRTQRSRVL